MKGLWYKNMKKWITSAITVFAVTLLYGCSGTDSGAAPLPEAEVIGAPENEEVSDTVNRETDGKEGSGQGEGNHSVQSGTEDGGAQAETVETEVNFTDISDRTFYFSSGAGAWWTELRINDDGSFSGIYQDSDMGDMGEDYPNGTLYYCEFSGVFESLAKVDEYTYKMKLASIEYEQEPEKEEIKDGVRNIYSTAYGIDGGDEFYLYLPGIKLTELPEEYRSWVGYYNLESVSETELPYYGLYNINTGDGFSSYVYEEQTFADRVAMEISFAEESSAELEEKLSKSTVQIDMDEAAKELFQTWDDTLNIIWKLLEPELSDEEMESLRIEERAWIARKEAEVKAAGQEYEGGSMQSMAEALKAAEMTKERVYELAERYTE